MNSAAIQKLRAKLAADQCAYGMWITLDAASITEMAVYLGLDWVVIDAEHGHLDWGDVTQHLRAAARSDTVAIVRITELNIGLVKRALDCGADGVMIPWMETAEQVRQAVSFAHYPPDGVRGIGGERATSWGQRTAEHVAEARRNTLVIPMIESPRGAKNVDAMLEVPGIEIIWFGPADFSSAAGFAGQWEGPGVAEAILATKDKIRKAGTHCGVIATSNENLAQRHEQGFRLLAVGSDASLLLRAAKEALATTGRPASAAKSTSGNGSSSVSPLSTLHSPLSPLDRPPDVMRPDRVEVIAHVGDGAKIEIAPGVVFEPQVGAHNQARNLTTGLVTLSPGVRLPYHTHTFGETITLLDGRVTVEVEGRVYRLDPLDNVTVRRGLAHSTANLSPSEPALIHIAVATDNPTRELVDPSFQVRNMPDDSRGVPGAEYVTRCGTAPRYAAGPNTGFVDYLNSDLIPGIEMSGGYGLFQPGARLPAHLHDFDESICIIDGTATCFVEGRKHTLGDRATALQPRGRVHYFINETNVPMAMIWVYAGPMPERIMVDERCATVAGYAWPSPGVQHTAKPPAAAKPVARSK